MKIAVAIALIGALLLPVMLNHAYALSGTNERSVTMKIVNTKTNTVTVKEWKLTYAFGERNIDVDDKMLTKIKRIFYTDKFSFTLSNKVFESEWLHYKVELIGTPLVGQGLKIKFI